MRSNRFLTIALPHKMAFHIWVAVSRKRGIDFGFHLRKRSSMVSTHSTFPTSLCPYLKGEKQKSEYLFIWILLYIFHVSIHRFWVRTIEFDELIIDFFFR